MAFRQAQTVIENQTPKTIQEMPNLIQKKFPMIRLDV